VTRRLELVTALLLIVALAVPLLSCASELVSDTGWSGPSAYTTDMTDAGDNKDASVYTAAGGPEVSDGKDNDYDLLVDPADGDPGSVQIQLALVLDGSGSISPRGWSIMLDGLAAAIRNSDCTPRNGTVELTVIQFSTSAILEVGPVVITDANVADVADEITKILQMRGRTCISCGLCLAADTLHNSPRFNPDIKQAINLVTDGEPDRCSCYSGGGCQYIGLDCNACPSTSGRLSAECARQYLLNELGMTQAQDELDAEFIGYQGSSSDWLKNNIVWPEQAGGNGYYAPPFDKGPGWVRVVTDIQQVAAALCQKMKVVIPPSPPGPGPGPTPEQPQPPPLQHEWCLGCGKRIADLPG
jgi:hypothetical protein